MAISPRTVQIMPSAFSGRVNRKPQHTFHLRSRPFSLTPFFIAPVLPGETMKNMLLQARQVTDPILNPIIGWWTEWYVFYVKHRDLDGRDDFTAMMLDVNYDLSAYDEAADPAYHHVAAASPNWLKLCLKRITEEYFRDEGEAWTVSVDQEGLPRVSMGQNAWLDSIMPVTDVAAVDVEATDRDADTKLEASEIAAAMREWEFAKLMGLADMSYEDYLRTYGINAPVTELHVPELVRYIREWQYPSNTIDPTNGTPRSAVSWAVAERADKDRLFREPGFLVGVTVVRPKVYSSVMRGNAVDSMDNAFLWLPAILQGDNQHSLKAHAIAGGPIPTAAVAYQFDVRDLLLYGDQFVNFDQATAVGYNEIARPGTTLTLATTKYPTTAGITNLFVLQDATPRIRCDGIVSLIIAGRQQDLTPRMMR